MEAKKFWKSKTFWVNVIGILVLAIPQLIEALTQTFPQADLISVWGGFVLAVLNIILRFVTEQPVEF